MQERNLSEGGKRMKTGTFSSPDEEFDQIKYVYSKIKEGLPEEYDTFEKFCGCLVYSGLSAFSRVLIDMGVIKGDENL